MRSNLEVFLQRFPEFINTDEKLLILAINEAKNELNPNSWGPMYETGLFFLVADKLAKSPMGEPVRLDASSNKTTYALEFERLCRCISMGARVA